MADEDKKDKAEDENPEKSEMSIAELTSAIGKLLPLLETVEQLKGAGMKNATTALDKDEDEKKDKAEDNSSEEKKDKAEDEDSDEKEKKDKAEDEDNDTKEKDAMDAAEVKNRLTNLENRSTEKSMRAQIAATDQLAKRVAQHVGTFDHSAMDEAEVVQYGVEKLGIKAPKGNERIALDAYLDGREAAKDTTAFAMDSVVVPKTGGLLAKRLNRAEA